MKSRILFLIILIQLPGAMVLAEDLSLQIRANSSRVLLGLPVTVEVDLFGDGKFALPEPFSATCSKHTVFVVRDQSGNRSNFSFSAPCGVATTSPFDSDWKTEYVDKVNAKTEIFLTEGKYTIYSVYRSKGPYLDRYSDSDQRLVEGVWQGEISSNEINVEVVFPDNQSDARALLELGPPVKTAKPEDYALFLHGKMHEILKNYPDSTYADLLIAENLDHPENLEPSKLIDFIKDGRYPLGNSVPDPTSPSGWKSVPQGKPMAVWQIDQAKRILKEHPEFPFAERLHINIGVNNLVLGKMDEARTALERATQNQSTEQAEWAKTFLQVLNQSGTNISRSSQE